MRASARFIFYLRTLAKFHSMYYNSIVLFSKDKTQ